MDYFHPAINNWFNAQFKLATEPQLQAWPAIKSGLHTLVAAPTGSGKTLAAFLSTIDDLIKKGLDNNLHDQIYLVYVSPLKALSNDIEKNLQHPLQGIADELNALGLPSIQINTWVRTGDTPPGDREKMRKQPPHILVTTPESLFILLSSISGREMLKTTRSVIVDEIHALASNKRGSHLSLSLERLESLTNNPLIRIGLSATQKPIQRIADFLIGNRKQSCKIIDCGYNRKRDIAIEVPKAPLEAIMSNEVWDEVYNRLEELILSHHTTLIFVNTRRLAERATRFLAERIGEEYIAAHHGSLAREHRLQAEQKLKQGQLKAMVATASLELGIDIGEIDLVCQLGTPRSISAFLQRTGRSGHSIGGTPKGRLFPFSRDDLLECVALIDAVQRGELDTISVPDLPLDVLAQQIIAEVAGREWDEDELYTSIKKAFPYQLLEKKQYQQILNMLAEGFTTRRGRRSAYIHRDEVNHKLRARKGARLTAVTNAGTIPDQFDYDVILEPQGQFIGSLNEDFAFESLPGDIFQLGNTSYRILKIEQGKVRVEDARGQPPNIPFWFGEAPGRSDELSLSVSRLRNDIEQQLKHGIDTTIEWLVTQKQIAGQAAVQLVEYLAATQAALGVIPTQQNIVFERFFDEAGDQHLVIHSTYGSRLNRAWGLALRKRFCRKFNFELQAAALEDTLILSLGPTHSFPLDEVKNYLKSPTVRDILIQAMLAAPMFLTHWRWNACIALAIKRNRAGKRVPAQFQRMDAEDLMAVVFPDQLACQENITGNREVPDHPLVQQTINDCLFNLMDIKGLELLLENIADNKVNIITRDLAGPSPLAQEILNARPYAFLDDAPAEERRTQAVVARRFMDPQSAAELGRLNPEAIQQVRSEAWPSITNADELHDALLLLGFMTAHETDTTQLGSLFKALIKEHRITLLISDHRTFWVAAERLTQMKAIYPNCVLQPKIKAVGHHTKNDWSFEASLIEILRGRLQGLGPVNLQTLAQTLNIDIAKIKTALVALENEGFIMQGHFTSGTLKKKNTEWCERALLARIHRYTLKQLRNEIQPVSASALMQFLFHWHQLDDQRNSSDTSLLATLKQMEGFPIPACAWETDILPARIRLYNNADLDSLCLSGKISWQRFTKNSHKKTGNPIRNTPVTLMLREHQSFWYQSAYTQPSLPELSSAAEKIYKLLNQQGASFFIDLVKHSGLLRTQTEDALAELVANGLITSDTFAGLRALTTPNHKRPRYARQRHRHGILSGNSMDNAGRWSLLPKMNVQQIPKKVSWIKTDFETLEYIAKTLLLRYGVVFRKLLERESLLPPWRELLYCYRLLEARGEIRGGRFVEGFAGEQFALSDAVSLLRKTSKNTSCEKLIAISAADPLNLSGIITPGKRVPALASNRVLYKNGIPVAIQLNGKTEFLVNLNTQDEWNIKTLLTKKYKPTSYHHSSNLSN